MKTLSKGSPYKNTFFFFLLLKILQFTTINRKKKYYKIRHQPIALSSKYIVFALINTNIHG